MREPDRPVDHLLAALDELLRAGLAVTAHARASAAASPSPFASPVRGLADLVEAWMRGRPELVRELASALEAEAARWDRLAQHDRAARRVRDIMRAFRDVLQPADEPPPERAASTQPSADAPSRKRRAPRHGSH